MPTDSRPAQWGGELPWPHLARKGPWIVDGPMGTELARLGWRDGPTHLANLQRPDWVRAIHQSWQQAGAQLHRTNTFLLLDLIARDEDTGFQCLSQGIRIARSSVAPGAPVLVSLGPVAPGQSPPATPPHPRWSQLLSQADGLVWETWSHPHVVDWAHWLNPARHPQIVSWTFRPNPGLGPFRTLGDLTIEACADLANKVEAIATGFNCGDSPTPEETTALVDQWQARWPGPLWCCPPGSETPKTDPLAGWKAWPAQHRLLVGGCCGTTCHSGVYARPGRFT